MNLLIKSTTILATILAATSCTDAGCVDDLGPAMGMQAAEEIVVASDWFEDNCDPMRRSKPPIDAEAECKQFAINYCIGNMKDAVEKFKSNCRGTPPLSLMNTWSEECSDEVSSLIPTPSPSPNPISYGCKWDSDCGQGMKCKNNMCVDKQKSYECKWDNDCGKGMKCKHNMCFEKQKSYGCKWDSDCGHGQGCKHNMCVDKQKNYGCTTNLECGQHMKCKNNMCMPKASESRALRGSNTD